MADLKKVENDGVYQAQAPLRTVLEDLDQIGARMAKVKSLRKTLGWSGVIFFIFGIVLFIAGLGAAGGLLLVAAVVLCTFALRYGRKLVKHTDRHQLLKELARVIQQDAAADSGFSVKVALAEGRTLLKEEPFPQRKNGKQKFFEEEFLTFQGELLDGTEFSESVTELSRQRTYTNPRGKTKTKTRKRYIVEQRFDYPTEVYGDAREAQQALQEEVQVPPSASVRDVRVSEKSVVVKALVQLNNEVPQASAMLAMGAYRILNLARLKAGKAGGQGGAQ